MRVFCLLACRGRSVANIDCPSRYALIGVQTKVTRTAYAKSGLRHCFQPDHQLVMPPRKREAWRLKWGRTATALVTKLPFASGTLTDRSGRC
jgi:hypothetical protein